MVKARWWPAGVILVLGAVSLAQAWLLGDTIRQYRVLQTIHTTVLVVLALLGWLLFASRLARRVRLGGLTVVLAGLGLLAVLFRLQGLSGDLVPILKPRWSAREEPAALASAPPPASPRKHEAAAGPSAPPPSRAPSLTPPSLAAPRVADYPQFLGPNRDATLEVGLDRDWSAHPPRRLWRQRIGAGWSAFAVAGPMAVTQEQRGPEELVVAYEVGTGQARWSHADTARYETLVAGIGPRATPTIVGSRVFTLGATGILNALDLATGRRLWAHQVVEEAGARVPDWGKSCSPLVIGHRVVVSAGGSEGRSLVAYDAQTGEKDWSAGSDRSSYSSPVLATLAGRPQILMFNQGSVAGHDPETGALLWEAPWSTEQPNVANPLPLPGDRLLLSAGYGVGAKLFRIELREDGGLAARLLWESPRLKSKFANLVAHDGFVYGLDDGVLTCLDPESGERRWKAGRYGHGQIVLARDLLLVQTEEGEVVLVEASPESHRELTRFRVLDGKTWNAPALAGPVLLVRSDQEAAAYELPLTRPAGSAGAE